jgi:hypothetical protein
VFGPIRADAVLAVRSSGLTGIAPNPASAGARIDFALTREDHVRIQVIDVAGRTVATLANRPMAAGSYSMYWDRAHDRLGVPAGLYFVRWESSSGVMSRRLVLLP